MGESAWGRVVKYDADCADYATSPGGCQRRRVRVIGDDMKMTGGVKPVLYKRYRWLALAVLAVAGVAAGVVASSGSATTTVRVAAAPPGAAAPGSPGCVKPYPGKAPPGTCLPLPAPTVPPAVAAAGVKSGPAQLVFAFTHAGVGGYGPDFVQGIWLDNTSRSACYLAGAPTLTLLTTTGKTVPVTPDPYYASHQALAGPGGQVVVTYGYPGDCTSTSNRMNLSKVIMSFPGGNITVPAAPGLAFSCGTPHIEDYTAVSKSRDFTDPPPGSIIGPAG